MNFLIASIKVNIKNIMSPYLFFPIVILVASLIISSFIEKELILQPDIGVFYKDTAISQEIIENLLGFSNINAIVYQSADEMLSDVAAHKIESGYVFSENIDKYVQSGTINRAVRLYKSPATVSDGFTNELVFAALMKAIAPYVAANYLTAGGGENTAYQEVLSDAQQTIRSYYDEDIFIDIQIIPAGGTPADTSGKGSISAGIVSVFIFVMFIYSVIGAIEQKKSGIFDKLSRTNRAIFLAANVIASALFIYALSLLSVFSIPGNSFTHKVLALFLYVALLALISFIAASLFNSAHTLYALLPVISVAVIILGGAFFDFGEAIPAFGRISQFFPTYYLIRFLQ